jgi:transcriptional regulator with XRE-family HTH domain
MPGTTKRRVVVDNTALAQSIGERIRTARHRAGLTQQQLAEGRYTKAYVSALEKGLAKPSMAALTFFADRLGLPPSHFLVDRTDVWTRIEADLHLASGDWVKAVDAYEGLLGGTTDRRRRAEILRGLSEALVRLDRGRDALPRAAESAELFSRLGQEVDAALASFWLASAHYVEENRVEARAIYMQLLDRVRAGLNVLPDFKLRLLGNLGNLEARDGEHQQALTYLEEARGLAADMDDRRRATFLGGLAVSYRKAGDLEAALKTGGESLALFRAAEAELEIAMLANEVAMAHLTNGNPRRAQELAEEAESLARRINDGKLLANVLDTRAQVALARGDASKALALAGEALALATREGSHKAKFDAHRTRARTLASTGATAESLAAFEEAAGVARNEGSRAQLREILSDWAAELAKAGQHERAYELTREALGPAN